VKADTLQRTQIVERRCGIKDREQVVSRIHV
jgi:hypothetical protein